MSLDYVSTWNVSLAWLGLAWLGLACEPFRVLGAGGSLSLPLCLSI
ncbi:hypothetical protein [Nostoc sp. KVJ20]|nr:hypothetical protein [Nostoc sp. KVJ20]